MLPLTEKFYVDAQGKWLGALVGTYVLVPVERPHPLPEDWVEPEPQYVDAWPDAPEGAIEVSTAPERASQIYDFDTETWSAALAPAVERVPKPIASAKLTVTDGFVEGFAADSAIAGGFAMDVGKFWMFFGTPQPDTDYIVNVFDGGLYRCYVQPADYMPDSFVVTTTDLSGVPADPTCISIIIMRAV